VHPLRALIRDRRSIISFGAGMSAAYAFVRVMPELDDSRRALVASVSVPLRYEGLAIYLLALVGFLVFYSLDHFRERLPRAGASARAGLAFNLHVGGFAAYVWLMAYLLASSPESTTMSTVLYTVAIVFHFLAVDHSLRREHSVAYERVGRFVLAGMSMLGWAVGLVVTLPHYVLALLMAFVSGAIIINSAIMELPTEKDGRFLPFVSGGLIYGLILLSLR
jgi:hypothetical protein